jgi:hypothetical protein
VRPSDFLADFFSAGAGSIYCCSLPAECGGQVAAVVGRGSGSRIDELVQSWDRPGRGTYFGVNTITPKQSRRCRETIHEIVAAHCDVDFKDIDLTRDQVLAKLTQLQCRPSKIVSSGHGYHCYWILKEAPPATQEVVAQTEALLRSLANKLAGDPAVAEVARIMRLPGSYNYKNGERLLVEVIGDRPLRYDLSDLLEFASELPVWIPRKARPGSDNPFLSEIPAPNGHANAAPPSEWRALVTDGAVEGHRNCSIAKLAGLLLCRFVDPIVTLELLQAWNATRCSPPLPSKDIERIVNSIAGRELRRRGGG